VAKGEGRGESSRGRRVLCCDPGLSESQEVKRLLHSKARDEVSLGLAVFCSIQQQYILRCFKKQIFGSQTCILCHFCLFLIFFSQSEAQELTLVNMSKFGGGIGAPSKEERLMEAAAIHVRLGQIQRYCELMVELGQVCSDRVFMQV